MGANRQGGNAESGSLGAGTDGVPRHRLFIDQLLAPGLSFTLEQTKAHYLARVLRLEPGAQIVCFNGDGHSYIASLSTVTRKTVSLEVETLFKTDKRVAPITLVLSLIKRDALDYALQKATELGVGRVQFCISARTDARVNRNRLDQKRTHWANVVRSACEQCGRNFVPELVEPKSLEKIASELTHTESAYLFHPDAAIFKPPRQPIDTTLFVGPEGGWSKEEIELCSSLGVTIAGLGNHILRADTAPQVCLGILQQSWGWP